MKTSFINTKRLAKTEINASKKISNSLIQRDNVLSASEIKNPVKKYLLNAVSDIELSFAPWQTMAGQTDILKARRSSDDSEDIIQADSNGVISDSSVMKASGQDLRTWTNDYSDTLYVVEYYFPDGTGMEQQTNANQPEFDPINWKTIYNGNYNLQSVSNDAPGKWEPFFQDDFGISFFCKRDDVQDSGATELGQIQNISQDILTILRAGQSGSAKLQGYYWAGSGNKFTTDGSYDPYNQKNTNYFTVTFLCRFWANEGQLIYNGTIIETVDISGIDPSGWNSTLGQLQYNAGLNLFGNIISQALYSNPDSSKVSTVETKLKEPVNAYTAFFIENNSGYILAASVLDKQSFYQNRSCRIRRSSDNAEVNVLWDSNDSISDSSLLEGSGDDLGTWSGNDTLYVRRVHDGSGYEDHLAQSDTAKQPTLDLPNNNVVFSSGDELVTEKTGNSFTSDFQTIQKTEFGEQPISSIKTTAEFYNEIRLEEGYSDTENVNPLTNFSEKSTAEPNATQATPSKRGEYQINKINGHPICFTDGVDDIYDSGSNYHSVFKNNFAGALVVDALDLSSSRFFMGFNDKGGGNRFQFQHRNSGELRLAYFNSSGDLIYDTDNIVLTTNTYFLLSFLMDFDNDVVKIRVNGSDVAISSTGANNISDVDPTQFDIAHNLYFHGDNTDGSENQQSNEERALTALGADISFAKLQEWENDINEKYAIY